MQLLADVPRGQANWDRDNPAAAAAAFLAERPEFVLARPDWLFNESTLSEPITYHPGGFLRRLR
jgi:hypothetical protein